MNSQEFEDCIEEYRHNRHNLRAWGESIRTFFEHHPSVGTGKGGIVHSIRFRMKDEDGLRKKLIRKRDKKGEVITAETLLQRVTDLVGVRILHLYQAQFVEIHNVINDQIIRGYWALHEQPVAYTWDPESKAHFESLGLRTELKESHYTSIHFVLKPSPESNFSCELQVRTLFEEAWGEIDHGMNYPEEIDDRACREQLRVLAKLVGACTRLGDSIFRSHSEAKARAAENAGGG